MYAHIIIYNYLMKITDFGNFVEINDYAVENYIYI